jgi:DNA-binding HxlR family transcriptional regulator
MQTRAHQPPAPEAPGRDAPDDHGAFCPRFHHAVELIGRRWTGVVVRAMLHGATRYSDIRAAVPALSDKMLAERLKELEGAGVVTRTVVPSTPVRVEYRLTPKGRALEAAVAAVAEWAAAWLPGAPDGAPDGACGCAPPTAAPSADRTEPAHAPARAPGRAPLPPPAGARTP